MLFKGIPLFSIAAFVLQSATVLANVCTLSPDCADNTPCTYGDLELQWSAAAPTLILLDGQSMSVARIQEDTVTNTIVSAHTTWRIVSEGPAILISETGYTGPIRPSQQDGFVTASLMRLTDGPRKYFEYNEIFERRRVYQGRCEELF